MKWKAMLALFDGVLVACFLALFLMPLAALGGGFFGVFWSRNWPAAAVFLAVLAAVNAWFVTNRRILGLLQAGDWPALATLLEERAFRSRVPRSLHVGLLANAYLATANMDGLAGLEALLGSRRPRLAARHALAFGIPRLVSRDWGSAEAWFAGRLGAPGLRERDWVRWNRAYCLVQLRRTIDAQTELEALAGSRDPVLAMLSLYLGDVCARGDGAAEARIEAGRRALAARVSAERMQRISTEGAGNVEVAMLAGLLADARQWLYAAGRPA
jgi:hypothetical protein